MDLFRYLRSLLLMAFIGLLTACAIISPPTGGEKDLIPPKIVRTQPENYSVHFKGNKIRLYFNEFVNFSMQGSQLVISPPLRKTPEVTLRGKSLILSFDDTLKENTTYTFNFGNTIADLNEGNQLKDFRFVFSTGSIIDSLSLKGNVYDAFTGLPMKDITVMLYDTLNDSAVYHQRPLFASISNETGFFRLENLPGKQFKIVALKDGNTNYLYDLATEQIAFLDSNITPSYSLPDSITKINPSKKDSLSKTNTLRIDSLVKINSAKNITMNLFTEKDSIQRVMKVIQPNRGTAIVYFTYPVTDLQVKPLFSQTSWNPIFEYNQSRDTIQMWYKSVDDTLSVTISDKDKVLDTVLIDQKKNVRSAKNAFDKAKTGNITNVQADWLNFYDTLSVTFSFPIEKTDFSRLELYQDSTAIQAKPILSNKNKRSIQILYPWKEATNYSILIRDSLIQDILGRSNDSLKVRFRLKPIEMYGTILLNFKPDKIEGPYIIQLIQKSGKIVAQRFVDKAQQLKFEFLDPGDYTFKLIIDKNNNRHWDTGRFIKKLQAEKVYILPTPITVRTNWDSEIDWNL
ncbi:MAG: Ig-like domain-containing protein [Bacteroidota bacterium]